MGFAARHKVDRYNLSCGNMELGPDGEGAFATYAVHKLRMIFLLWWALMAAFFMKICSQGTGQHGKNRATCPPWMLGGAYALCVVATLIFLLSWLTERYAWLHENTIYGRKGSNE